MQRISMGGSVAFFWLAYRRCEVDLRPGQCHVKTLGKFLTPMCNVVCIIIEGDTTYHHIA